MRQRGIKPKVMGAILTGRCNTSQDVADETGLSVARCSKCISSLADIGILSRTDRILRRSKGGHLRIFEVRA
jgi:predicted transcriptional regulator